MAAMFRTVFSMLGHHSLHFVTHYLRAKVRARERARVRLRKGRITHCEGTELRRGMAGFDECMMFSSIGPM